MHVLSELRNPLFDAPDRQRALRALQMSRILRENNGAKAWQAVRNMIDRAIAEHNVSPKSQSRGSSSYASPQAPLLSSTLQVEATQNDSVRVYPAMGAIPNYAIQNSSGGYTQSTNPAQAPPMQAPLELLPPFQPMQDQTAPCWDDININNINNIVGDVQPTPGIIPDFDFVSTNLGHTCKHMLIDGGVLGRSV